ncbi:MAG TPA: redox-sensing transcriptional repressor Rex [Caldisericia bacterium]|nr:redox-sensing transcriptional repressor Rex [Caldisericia bacterium]HOL83130.1 redox-sensing transcriptional repressor Rex [Caldisericia bacterium]HON82835.1 redox-sensing transcriptional repressor Rex [Caldisericia bacterium]HPC57107.1 redox-sensing transcriptional repressor Rex [Caldisericia bacterium]HPP43498.1 redox-sensing transcriptional repressor Rex [Caldisericia bacterium]
MKKTKKEKKFSNKTIERLALYYEILITLPFKKKFISSEEIGYLAGVSPSTVRQDFLHFDEIEGRAKIGYEVTKLKEALRNIFKLNSKTHAVIVGAGSLGQAIAGYDSFKKSKVVFDSFFDNNPNKIGRLFKNIFVRDIKYLKDYLKENRRIKIVVICVPPKEAQSVVNLVVDSGIKMIWNFSPTILKVPPDVFVEYEHIGVSFYRLLFKRKTLKKEIK